MDGISSDCVSATASHASRGPVYSFLAGTPAGGSLGTTLLCCKDTSLSLRKVSRVGISVISTMGRTVGSHPHEGVVASGCQANYSGRRFNKVRNFSTVRNYLYPFYESGYFSGSGSSSPSY